MPPVLRERKHTSVQGPDCGTGSKSTAVGICQCGAPIIGWQENSKTECCSAEKAKQAWREVKKCFTSPPSVWRAESDGSKYGNVTNATEYKPVEGEVEAAEMDLPEDFNPAEIASPVDFWVNGRCKRRGDLCTTAA
ncbi:hypothetical protein BDD12DRAFT_800747 [Trichophaea hybrida]|nr:hypothetical protein BDD12DRAFT_800747 [Trichophaea hybrida]